MMGPLDVMVLLSLGDLLPNQLLYIDPGSGALILQFLAGVGLGIAYYFRQAIGRVKSIVPGLDSGDD